MVRQSSIGLAIVVSLAVGGTAVAGGAHGGVTITKGTTSGFTGNVHDHRGDTPPRHFGPPNGGWRENGAGASAIRDHR